MSRRCSSSASRGDLWRINLVVPHIEWTGAISPCVVAVFGTTISPYLFFWQASEEVEDEKEDPAAEPLLQAPGQAPRQLARIQARHASSAWERRTSSRCSSCSRPRRRLNAHGVTDIQTSADAAKALQPIAGEFAFMVFALGIVGTGLLAVPVLAGSAAYALGEALEWRVGLAERPGRAPAFYGAIALATLVGALLNFTPLDPIKALFWSAVINGVAAVPIMVMIMLMASRRKVMGEFALPAAWLKALRLARHRRHGRRRRGHVRDLERLSGQGSRVRLVLTPRPKLSSSSPPARESRRADICRG